MTDSKENDSVDEKSKVHKSDPKQKQSKVVLYLLRDTLQIIFFASPMLGYHAIRLITNQRHHGGFFCDDNSIKYPYKESRISEIAVVIQTISIPIIIIILLETYIHNKLNKTQDTKTISSLIERIYKYVINYLSAYIVCCSFMWLPKYFNGNLRPHFFDVCQPVLNIDDSNPCEDPKNFGKFIIDYYCSKTYMPSIYRTFPSGHASQSCFAVCYLIMFIQRKINAIRLRIFSQFLLLCYAIFVSLSRIYDHHHHPVDVVFGALLGLLCGVVVVKVVENDFFLRNDHQEKEK